MTVKNTNIKIRLINTIFALGTFSTIDKNLIYKFRLLRSFSLMKFLKVNILVILNLCQN